MATDSTLQRSIGLVGAIGIGVGAIVGGGILALAGAAFAATGPSAILAFALNGVIAVITALSFAELSCAFPQSGGTYTFAKKVLSVEAAFAVGWVVWFASIVAAVLYALGFGYFAAIVVQQVWQAVADSAPQWLASRWIVAALAVAAIALYTIGLLRKGAGGGQWANVGKLVVFGVVIAAGLWAMTGRSASEMQQSLTPFFSAGAMGLVQAMGFTFIALQGFDLIAAVAGEIREPERNIPRAMLTSLGIALLIYLPLLLVISTVGVAPGQSITVASKANPEAIIAVAAQQFLGSFGYWLVIVAALLSMLSALQANLFAASRVAMSMARDRTLPHAFSVISETRGTPVTAILVTSGIVVAIVLVVPNVSAAGAASSLFFLITFSLAHMICYLARKRSGDRWATFRAPLFPLVPAIGVLACMGLAVFQGFAVPSAGMIAAVWLCIGGGLFLSLFAQQARVVDASAAAQDPEMLRMRGQNPLVLVPIANPANAAAMVEVATALAPPRMGRVLLLSVVVTPEDWQPAENPKPLEATQAVLGQALAASRTAGLSPEALTTMAPQPWLEITRVCKIHRCESLLLGLSDLSTNSESSPLDELMGSVTCDVVVLRAPAGWQLQEVQRLLVPIGGVAGHDQLRARLLGSLFRTGPREVTFLRVLPETAKKADCDAARRELERIARDEAPGRAKVEIILSPAADEVIARYAAESDLLILGVQRLGRGRKAFGRFTLQVARHTTCPIMMISHRG